MYFLFSPPTCTKYSAFERDGLLLKMQLSKPLLQPAVNVWGFVLTFYKTEIQILHKVCPLYHTFPCMQTAMKVAFIWQTMTSEICITTDCTTYSRIT